MIPADVILEFRRLGIIPSETEEFYVVAINGLVIVTSPNVNFLDDAAAKLRRSGRFAWVRERPCKMNGLIFEWDREENDEPGQS